MPLLIKGGTVVDPLHQTMEQADILVRDGRVAEIGSKINADAGEMIDAAGKLVTPGLIDMHVHLREPGYEAKETIASGTRAAARGGFTAVACMPNTKPVADNQAVIQFIRNRAREQGLVRVYPIGALTKGSLGGEISEMAELQEAGAVALSDDGQPVSDAGVMRRALQYAAMLDLTVISHCEDKQLANSGCMHEGLVSTVLGLPGIPAAAEEIMVARDIILAEAAGCPLHLAHISTAGSVRLVRAAKARGLRVTAEATPHHFTLTDQAVTGYDTNTKVNPPLRPEADREAIRRGLQDGTIDVIATDHAPHTFDEKDVEYAYAPFGLVGLETAVALVFTELVGPGLLTVPEAIARLSANPARILGLPGGRLTVGGPADITIIDPALTQRVDPANFAGKGRNTPFAGRELTGWPVATIVGGRTVMQDRRLCPEDV